MAFGIGAHAGIWMISFLVRASIKMPDEAASESTEALNACGAHKVQTIFQGVIPAVLPGFIAWFLYVIETNIRASTILGMAGAASMGLLVMSYFKQFKYHEACSALLSIAWIIIPVNRLTEYWRKKVLS
jgi:phosphonate transport system permease protein